MNKTLKEQKLIIFVKEGNLQAFDELFFKYERKLLAYSYKLIGNIEDAQEVVQEVFIKIWERRSLIDESINLDGYIFKIAKHIIYNKAKKTVYDLACKEYYKCNTATYSPITESQVEYNELMSLINTAVESLPNTRKQIFLMSR